MIGDQAAKFLQQHFITGFTPIESIVVEFYEMEQVGLCGMPVQLDGRRKFAVE